MEEVFETALMAASAAARCCSRVVRNAPISAYVCVNLPLQEV